MPIVRRRQTKDRFEIYCRLVPLCASVVGDGLIDVLAWRTDTQRVLLIECKHVQHRKTEGEIAEQLADFRGEIKPDGKPDLLLRHIRRVTVISESADVVAKYVGIFKPKLEGHLVFKNPVPMKFAWTQMEKKMPLHIFSDLDRL